MLSAQRVRERMSARRELEERGFDRGRILEWLESIQQSPEPDEGSDFDPDKPPAATRQPSLQSQQQQQQQQQQQIQRLHHLLPLLQRHVRSPANARGAPAKRADSATSLPMSERAVLASTDITLSQPRTHLHSSLHTRQKSESPLPEVPTDSGLPTFDPQTPTPPGNRTPRHSLRSESRHLPSVLIHARPGLGSVTLSCPVLHPPEINPPQTLLRSPSPLTSSYQVGRQDPATADSEKRSLQTLGDVEGQEEEGEELEVERDGFTLLAISQGCPGVNPPLSDSATASSCEEDATQGSEDPPLPLLPGNQATCVLEPQLHCSIDTSLLEETSPRAAEPPPELVPLSSLELATLSLKVVDILPQLAVYLGVEYREYEGVVASEPSPQRQSMSVLMKWYRSSGSRQSLAQALQQFGEQYSQLAHQLLTGGLEESRHTLSEEAVPPPKLSPSPAPLSHPHPPPLPTPPPTHTSQENRRHIGSPSPSPSSILSPQSRRLKQGFTFDEDRRSSDYLPKLLSARSLFTLSPDHTSPLVQGSRTPRSQPVQRHLSLSDVSSTGASSWPTFPGVGGALRGHTYPTQQRKLSLPHDELVELSGRGYDPGRRGSSERAYFGGRRKSSLLSDEVLLSLAEYDRDIPATTVSGEGEREAVVKARVGRGSVELGGGKSPRPETTRLVGDTPLRHRVIGSRSDRAAHPRGSSIGSRQLLGGLGRRELGASVARRPETHGTGGLTGGSHRAIDRQDSGIETLASNFSSLH